MDYVYPAVFQPNEDGTFSITFPDLPGCISEGKDLADALRMAESALSQMIEYMTDKNLDLPIPTELSDIMKQNDSFANLVRVARRDSRAIRRTVSIPKWMDEKAIAMGLSLSKVLQDALKAKLA